MLDSWSYILLLLSAHCGWLTLIGDQVPTKAVLSLFSSAGEGHENLTKGSRVEIKTGRNHSLIAIMGETDLTWGKLLNLLLIKFQIGE